MGIRRRVYFIFALMFSLYLLNPVYGQDVTREFHTMQGKIIISGQVEDSLLVIKSENAFISVNYETAEIVIKVNNNSFIPVGSNMIEKSSFNYNTELFFKGKLGIDYMITKKHPFMEFGFDGLLIQKNGEAFVAGNGSLEHIFADEYACILNLEFKVSPDLLGIDWPGHDDVNIRIIRTILKRVNE